MHAGLPFQEQPRIGLLDRDIAAAGAAIEDRGVAEQVRLVQQARVGQRLVRGDDGIGADGVELGHHAPAKVGFQRGPIYGFDEGRRSFQGEPRVVAEPARQRAHAPSPVSQSRPSRGHALAKTRDAT